MSDQKLTPEERTRLIDRLDRSFMVMPMWAKVVAKHAMCAPLINPDTGAPFASFREVIQASSDQTLITLRDDFEDNGDLLPEVMTQ